MKTEKGYRAFEKALKKGFQDALKNDPDNVGPEMWSGLANVTWHHTGKHYEVNYSFRSAGALIAEIRGEGRYMDWYCSGPHAEVSHRMACSLKKEGWIYDDIPAICDVVDCIQEVIWGWSSKDGYRNTCSEHYDGAMK